MENEILDAPFDEPEMEEVIPVDKGKRFANYFIDMIMFYISIFLLAIVFEFMGIAFFHWMAETPIVDKLISIILYGIFMCIQELSFGGRSIGKFITGTKVVDEDGYRPNNEVLIKRNLVRCVPFDQLSFLGDGSGWHDTWSDTYVVSAR